MDAERLYLVFPHTTFAFFVLFFYNVLSLAETTLHLGFTAFRVDNGRWCEYELRLWFGEGLRWDWQQGRCQGKNEEGMN